MLETFFESLSALATGTRTKYSQLLKRLFLWAKRKGYITESPISDESTIKGEKGAERRRRIYPDEEDRLLAVAPRRLQALIIAALESLCRLGEVLALKGEDVHLDNRTLLIAAEEVGARKTYGHATLAQTSKYLHADEFVLPDVMRRFE